MSDDADVPPMPEPISNLPPAPTDLSTLSSSQQRLYLAEQRVRQQLAVAYAEQNKTIAFPPPAQVRRQGPAGCLFDPGEMQRVPVVLTDEARAALLHLHHEARIFPQALEEALGRHCHGQVGRCEVSVEHHDIHGDRLILTLIHQQEVDGHPNPPPQHVHRLSLYDIGFLHGLGGVEQHHVPPTPVRAPGEPAFYAALTADDIARQYPHRLPADLPQE